MLDVLMCFWTWKKITILMDGWITEWMVEKCNKVIIHTMVIFMSTNFFVDLMTLFIFHFLFSALHFSMFFFSACSLVVFSFLIMFLLLEHQSNNNNNNKMMTNKQNEPNILFDPIISMKYIKIYYLQEKMDAYYSIFVHIEQKKISQFFFSSKLSPTMMIT